MNNYKPVIAASVFLLLFLLLGTWLIIKYVDSERERDMFNWQDRLAILAESHQRSIEDWLGSQLKNLEELAGNPLTQIYVSLETAPQDQTEIERGQAAHLRNLLAASAKRSGLFTRPQQLRADPAESSNDGLAIIDAQNRVLISTRNFPRVNEDIIEAIALARRNRRASIHGIVSNLYRQPRLIFAVPVSRVQAAAGTAEYPGFVVAVIDPELSLYKIITRHWLTTSTDEAILVSGDDNSTIYLSPLRNDYQVFHRAAMSSDELAANFAWAETGDFASKLDYLGNEVLVTGRSIDDTNWVLMQKIDASEALRESSAYQDFVHTVFLLALFIVTVGFIAIWRHATSVRLQKTSERLAAKTALLNAVGDNIRDHIFLLGRDENIVFINRALSDSLGVHYEEIVGKSLHHIFSIDTCERLLALKTDALAEHGRNQIMNLTIADSMHDYHVSLVSLMQGEFKDSLLYVLHDITELRQAQDRHNQLLEGIISTLVRATDMHDPHCAYHSERTREVAVAIARAMDVPEENVSVLSMAALLANIGKLYLPREILTKHTPLTEDDERILHQHLAYTIEILKDLEFDGPVIQIIEQKNERADGDGYPAGLKAEEIMLEARILAVANAFVAMSSARAYRPGMPVNEVIDTMLQQADTVFDRHVVAALFHVAENRSDWKNWQAVKMS